MGELLERVKLSNLVNGDGIADAYKNNSLYLYINNIHIFTYRIFSLIIYMLTFNNRLYIYKVE
jgi:hypothetical protein